MTKTVAIDARLVGGTSTGDSTYWTGLLHGLAATTSDEALLFISNKEKPPDIPWNSRWRWLHIPARSNRWWSLVAFPLAARKARAAAVHVQYNLSPLVRHGGVTTIHDVSFFIGADWFGAKDRFLLQRFVPAAVRRSKRVIAVSETCRNEIERFIPAARGKTVVTPEAAAPWIEPMDRRAAQARVAELVGVREPYLFTLGTAWARKNQALAIEAVKLCPSAPRLYIGGKAGDEDTIGNRIRRIGYVNQSELSAFYSGAEAHILPSLHEGFGITVLEAFACGCPVLCGSGGALPEVSGGAATIVPSYDAEAWADALRNMLSSNLDALRERGRRRAAEFSWAATARLTRQVYTAVVNP
ncbi:MAG: glycosyltransferase family 4 protein [Fimbriimonadaceae bacterium]